MVDVKEVLIWFIFVCISNFALKRALGVGFWDSFTKSSRISENTGAVIHFVFLLLVLTTSFLWII